MLRFAGRHYQQNRRQSTLDSTQLHIQVCQNRDVEKIKTIGDCYMAVAWPSGNADNADSAMRVLRAAQEMHSIIGEFDQAFEAPLSLRVGMHGGPVVSGMIGKTKFCFDIWGVWLCAYALRATPRFDPGGITGRPVPLVCHALQHVW